MQICDLEDITDVLHREAVTQRLLAHHLQSLQCVLVSRGQQVRRHTLQVSCRLAGVDEPQQLRHHLRLHVLHLHPAVLLLLHVVGEHGLEDLGASRQDGFVALELSASTVELHVGELRVFKEGAKIITEFTVGYFELK